MRSGSDATTITLRTAALALAGGPPGGSAQRRLRAAVRDQARRAGVREADADDVMAEVALALLGLAGAGHARAAAGSCWPARP